MCVCDGVMFVNVPERLSTFHISLSIFNACDRILKWWWAQVPLGLAFLSCVPRSDGCRNAVFDRNGSRDVKAVFFKS